MINSVIEAVSVSLNAEFGDKYTIYTEELKQGLKEPCFFISCINSTHKLFRGLKGSEKYFRKNQFCIQYFPINDNRGKEECNNIAERLEFTLEWLNIRKKIIRGRGMRYEIVNGILHF